MKLRVAALLLLSSATISQQATAAPTSEKIKDWELRCSELNGQNKCAMRQIFTAPDGKTTLGAIVIVRSPDGQQLAADVTVPLGVVLPAGIGLQVDQAKPTVYPYMLCEPRGCHAQIPFDAKLVTAFKKGKLATFSIMDVQKKVARGTVSLRGFTAAFNRLN